VQDFTTSFTVGTDVYPPVLRKISPINGQIGIGFFQQIVATFKTTALGYTEFRESLYGPPPR